MNRVHRVVSAALCFLLLFGASAVRAGDFGAYAGVSTISPCPSFCGGTGSHFDSTQNGGEGLASAAASLTTTQEGTGTATASLTGPRLLPVLGVFADSNPNARVTGQAVGYNAYHYVGAAPTTIEVELVLEGAAAAAAVLDASGRASVAVILGDDLPFYTSYGTLVFEEIPGNPNLDLLGTTELFLPVNVGNTIVTGSIPIDLAPGDKFFVWASLTGSGVRNGIVDADNTFTASFSDPSNIVPATIPEPATASLFLLAAAGVACRTSRRRSER